MLFVKFIAAVSSQDGVSSMDFCLVPRGRDSCRARGPPLRRAGGPLAERGKAEGERTIHRSKV